MPTPTRRDTLALGHDGTVGAYAVQPGFTYAVTFGDGHATVTLAASLFSGK